MGHIEGLKKHKVAGIFLFLSLALNLLLVGILAGRLMTHHPPPRPLPSDLNWLTNDISMESRRKLKTKMAKHRGETRSLRHSMFEAQKSFNQLLQNEDLDEARLKEALSRIRDTSSQFQTAMHEQMIPLLIEMDVEDRKNALKMLRMHRRPPRLMLPGNRSPRDHEN